MDGPPIIRAHAGGIKAVTDVRERLPELRQASKESLHRHTPKSIQAA